jgi:hypothetical protein
MRRLVLLVVLPVAFLFALAACAGSDSIDTTDAIDTTPPESEPPAGQLTDQYGVRYCEVLAVTITDANTKAEVWGTQGLNDCPEAAFSAIDLAAVSAELGSTTALANGPRYWVLDDIVANELAGTGEIRDFGGIEMRSIATVDLGPGLPNRSPYTPVSVNRDTEFRFESGRTIYELTAPDGSSYVMQSYSQEVDPILGVAALDGLGTRLALPDGWTFRSRTLDEPLVVEDDGGVATVVQDELKNSYQLRSPAAR